MIEHTRRTPMISETKWQARHAQAVTDTLCRTLTRLADSLEATGARPQVVEAARLAAADAEGLARRVKFVRRVAEELGEDEVV